MRKITVDEDKDLRFFFGGEVVHNVEQLSNLLRGLTFNHISDGLAAHITVGNIRESLLCGRKDAQLTVTT